MYYQEKFLNGRLVIKTTPDGEWRQAVGEYADTANAVYRLADTQREELFSHFCQCGSTDTGCQCWNDE